MGPMNVEVAWIRAAGDEGDSPAQFLHPVLLRCLTNARPFVAMAAAPSTAMDSPVTTHHPGYAIDVVPQRLFHIPGPWRR